MARALAATHYVWQASGEGRTSAAKPTGAGKDDTVSHCQGKRGTHAEPTAEEVWFIAQIL